MSETTRHGDESDRWAESATDLLMLDYTWRLAGIREEGDSLEWNVRFGHPTSQSAFFRIGTDAGRTAEIRYDRHGAELRLAGKCPAGLIPESRGSPLIAAAYRKK